MSAEKWITIKNNQLHTSLSAGTSSSLQKINDPLNLIAIFGRARQGKSFLMNCLSNSGNSGSNMLFPVSNEKESCTQGIDLANTFLTLNEFSRIDGGRISNINNIANNANNMKIGFVDCEGQGDKDVTYDATLSLSLLLLSKVIIFNWKGDLQKDHILETLGIITKAANNVANTTNDDNNNSNTVRPKFGHLHIIFRDWQSVNSDVEDVFNMLFQPESTTTTTGKKVSTANASTESASSAVTRDAIRKTILESFESVKIWLFDAPTDSVKDLKSKLTIDKTTFIFREQIRELRGVLSEQLKTPTTIINNNNNNNNNNKLQNSIVLKGTNLQPYLRQLISIINSGDIVMPVSAYVNMVVADIDAAVKTVTADLRQTMLAVATEFLEPCKVNNNNNNKSNNNNSGVKKAVLMVSEREVLGELQRRLNNIKTQFNHHLSSAVVVGIDTDVMIQQVVADAVAVIDTTIQQVTNELQQQYQNVLLLWLLEQKKAAEQYVQQQMDILDKPTTTTTTTKATTTMVYRPSSLRSMAEDVLKKALLLLTIETTKGSTNESVVADMKQQVTQLYEQLVNNLINNNNERIRHHHHNNKQVLLQAVQVAIEEMKESIHTNAIALQQQQQQQGYPRQLLEDSLNEMYEEKLDSLLSLMKQHHLTVVGNDDNDFNNNNNNNNNKEDAVMVGLDVETEFTKACKDLRPLMIEVYQQQREKSVNNNSNLAKASISAQLTFEHIPHQLNNNNNNNKVLIDANAVAAWSQQVVEKTVASLLLSVRCWSVAEEHVVVVANHVKQHAAVVVQELLADVEASNRQTQLDIDAAAAAAAVAVEMEVDEYYEDEENDEDEDDDDNSKENKEHQQQQQQSKRRRSSTSTVNTTTSSKKEQIARANQFMKTNSVRTSTSKPTTTATATGGAAKSNRATMSKQMQQTLSTTTTTNEQIERAQEWAKKNNIVISNSGVEEDDELVTQPLRKSISTTTTTTIAATTTATGAGTTDVVAAAKAAAMAAREERKRQAIANAMNSRKK